MKLKQLPEDFKVEELNEFAISEEKKPFRLYLLEKRGLETFSLLRYLAKANKIPLAEFGIAGLKDRHALTRQYLSIPAKYDITTLREKNFTITFLGYVARAVKLGSLKGNRFEIAVRDVRKGEFEGVYNKAKTVSGIGVPNYFDSQRFGSVVNKQFIAKFLIKKDYETAVKLYLVQCSRFEKSSLKQERKRILANWHNLLKLNIQTPRLAKVVTAYNQTRSWIEAYKQIAPEIREIIISAYQSYLWNECIKHLLFRKVHKRRLYHINYNVGSLVFYKSLTEVEFNSIPETFKTVSNDVVAAEFELDVMHEVLDKEGVKLQELDSEHFLGNFMGVYDREILLSPLEFKILPPVVDEVNDKGKNNRFKILLSFSLPKGSYATIITKRLFNQ